MRELSTGQLKAGADILGNIAVAWFSAGIVSPVFVRPKTVIEFLILLAVGLIMASIFATGSLFLVRKVNHD